MARPASRVTREGPRGRHAQSLISPTEIEVKRTMFYTYILKSRTSGRYYTGYSSDPSRRLQSHNAGKVTSTRNKGPWYMVWSASFHSKSEAIQLERRIKKRGAARFLNDISDQTE